MELIKLPVLKRTKQYTCGQWSFVYPPFKGTKTMNTEINYTVTSQNCVKLLSDLEHGTMFIFPDKPEQLCMITNTMDGTYYFVELTTGNMHRTSPRDFEDVNPVSHFKGQITLA